MAELVAENIAEVLAYGSARRNLGDYRGFDLVAYTTEDANRIVAMGEKVPLCVEFRRFDTLIEAVDWIDRIRAEGDKLVEELKAIKADRNVPPSLAERFEATREAAMAAVSKSPPPTTPSAGQRFLEFYAAIEGLLRGRR